MTLMSTDIKGWSIDTRKHPSQTHRAQSKCLVLFNLPSKTQRCEDNKKRQITTFKRTELRASLNSKLSLAYLSGVSQCRLVYVQHLILEGCFRIHLLKRGRDTYEYGFLLHLFGPIMLQYVT